MSMERDFNFLLRNTVFQRRNSISHHLGRVLSVESEALTETDSFIVRFRSDFVRCTDL